MGKKIILNCTHCRELFEKEGREYRRQIKEGKDIFYCSLSCVCKERNKNNPPKGNVKNLRADNRRDEFTPFRWFVLRAEYRDRNKNCGCDLTIEHLKNLWESQNGKCPFTGQDLILPQDSDGWKEYSPYNASVDRIDNSKGYVRGNVRFISVMANLARQSFSDIQLIEFCKAVAKHEMATS